MSKTRKVADAGPIVSEPAALAGPDVPIGETIAVVDTSVSPQQAAAALGKTPLAGLLQSLDGEAVAIGNAISDFETMVDKELRIIHDAPAETGRLLKEHADAFAYDDRSRMEAASKALRELREKVSAAETKLKAAVASLDRLAAQRDGLRLRTVDTQNPIRIWHEAARLAVARLSGRLDLADNLGGKIGALRRKLEPYLPAKEPESPVAAVTPEAPASPRPKCPRCLRTECVSEKKPGVFVCNRGYHGVIVFNGDGEITAKGHAAFMADQRHMTRNYRDE